MPRLAFRSRHLDQALSFLRDKNIRLEITRRHQRSLDVCVEGVYLPDGLYIGSTEYGAAANVQVTPQRLDYWLLMPLRGQMETEALRRHFTSDVRRGFLFSYPVMGPSRIAVDGGALRMTVVVSHESLHRQLAALLGRPADTVFDPPLGFSPVMDLTSGHGRSIARLAQLVLQRSERGCSPIAMSSVEQFVITELLMSQPHNHSGALYGPGPAIGPRDVKRAIDYMQANLDAPLTLADIVTASGVPGRTLFEHFRRFRGVSPIEYLRASRFERAHQALQSGKRTNSIADLAMSCGFAHAGRFSTEYRKRFGESPSATLRRSR